MSSVAQATFSGRITSIESIAPTVRHCVIALGRTISYQPGQYGMVAVGNTARAFSFVTLPDAATVEFLINTAPGGPASQFFSAAQPADPISFTAPYGDFTVDLRDPRPLLYLAGGVGVAPIIAHIVSLVEQESPRPITLLVGHKSEADVFWDQKLRALAAVHHFSYQMHIGPLIPHLAAIQNLSEHMVYLCGSAAMCTATAEALYKLGVNPAQVNYELFT
jgi:ferredoxin-NADP reductase